MFPSFPVIAVYKDSYLGLIHENSELKSTVLSVLVNQKENDRIVFDVNGRMWTYMLEPDSPKARKINFLSRLLALTFYNPWLKVTPKWRKLGTYSLPELKEALNRCVDDDEDVLTQFVEADFLKDKIDDATSFEELCLSLHKYIFIENEKEIWRETEEYEQRKASTVPRTDHLNSDLNLLIDDRIVDLLVYREKVNTDHIPLDYVRSFIVLEKNGVINFPFTGDLTFSNIEIQPGAAPLRSRIRPYVIGQKITVIYYQYEPDGEPNLDSMAYIKLSNGYAIHENRMAPCGTGMADLFIYTPSQFSDLQARNPCLMRWGGNS